MYFTLHWCVIWIFQTSERFYCGNIFVPARQNSAICIAIIGCTWAEGIEWHRKRHCFSGNNELQHNVIILKDLCCLQIYFITLGSGERTHMHMAGWQLCFRNWVVLTLSMSLKLFIREQSVEWTMKYDVTDAINCPLINKFCSIKASRIDKIKSEISNSS